MGNEQTPVGATPLMQTTSKTTNSELIKIFNMTYN